MKQKMQSSNKGNALDLKKSFTYVVLKSGIQVHETQSCFFQHTQIWRQYWAFRIWNACCFNGVPRPNCAFYLIILFILEDNEFVYILGLTLPPRFHFYTSLHHLNSASDCRFCDEANALAAEQVPVSPGSLCLCILGHSRVLSVLPDLRWLYLIGPYYGTKMYSGDLSFSVAKSKLSVNTKAILVSRAEKVLQAWVLF